MKNHKWIKKHSKHNKNIQNVTIIRVIEKPYRVYTNRYKLDIRSFSFKRLNSLLNLNIERLILESINVSQDTYVLYWKG